MSFPDPEAAIKMAFFSLHIQNVAEWCHSSKLFNDQRVKSTDLLDQVQNDMWKRGHIDMLTPFVNRFHTLRTLGSYPVSELVAGVTSYADTWLVDRKCAHTWGLIHFQQMFISSIQITRSHNTSNLLHCKPQIDCFSFVHQLLSFCFSFRVSSPKCLLPCPSHPPLSFFCNVYFSLCVDFLLSLLWTIVARPPHIRQGRWLLLATHKIQCSVRVCMSITASL